MKTILTIILTIIFSAQISEAQWESMDSGMGATDIRSFAKNNSGLFAGTCGNNVFFSTNNGLSWNLNSFALQGRCFTSLAVNGNNIFVGITGGPVGTEGAYLSTNNGTNWTLTSLNNLFINVLAVSGNSIFAGTDNSGVYKSTDNGANWVQSGLNNRTILSMATNGNNIYAGTLSYGLYISSNNGANWVQTSINNMSVASIAVSENRIFAGTTSNGVYYSSDNGANWIQTSLDTVTQVTSIIVNGNNVFAGSFYSGFSVSNDNGVSWVQKNEGLPNSTSIRRLFIANDYIFAGTSGSGVFRRPLSEVIGIHSISNEVPKEFSLSQNFPNPFNPSTNIRFEIAVTKSVELRVYDSQGKEIAQLYNGQLQPGTYEINWNGLNFPSGVYFYRLNAGAFSETKKMVLIK
ncbi:MAG: T9SS type A sorting domain-containing protein [Ignavibacteria bacterium]|nr:T9SS type A sorting domain-containing protein [Ignavibacteria bacterium]